MYQRSTILIVDNSLDFTGALKAILSMAIALSDSYEFIFVLPRKTRIAHLVRDHKFRVHTLPFIELSKRPRDVFFYLPMLIINSLKLSRLMKKYRAKKVHLNDYYNMVGIVTKAIAPSFNLVTHIRKLPDSFPIVLNKIWLALNAKFSESTICVSLAVKKQLGKHYPSVLIYDGISSEEQYPPRESFNRNPSEIRLLYLGHFIPGKGQDYALEAFRRVFMRCKDLRLRFVGGDLGLQKNKKFRESLQKKTLAWGIDNVVEFKGFSHDIEKEIKEADIMLNFSESESFSFTCLEALYYGTPLIASDSGGPAELFEHKHSGYLVRNKDVDAMAEAILFLAESPDERRKYSMQSRQYSRKKFSDSKSYRKLRNIYTAGFA